MPKFYLFICHLLSLVISTICYIKTLKSKALIVGTLNNNKVRQFLRIFSSDVSKNETPQPTRIIQTIVHPKQRPSEIRRHIPVQRKLFIIVSHTDAIESLESSLHLHILFNNYFNIVLLQWNIFSLQVFRPNFVRTFTVSYSEKYMYYHANHPRYDKAIQKHGDLA